MQTEVFRQGEVPTQICYRHQSWFDAEFAEMSGPPGYEAEAAVQAGDGEAGAEDPQKRHPFRRWLKRVFGNGNGGGGNNGNSGDGDGQQDAQRSEDRDEPPPP